jgi:hypothetical protein
MPVVHKRGGELRAHTVVVAGLAIADIGAATAVLGGKGEGEGGVIFLTAFRSSSVRLWVSSSRSFMVFWGACEEGQVQAMHACKPLSLAFIEF